MAEFVETRDSISMGNGDGRVAYGEVTDWKRVERGGEVGNIGAFGPASPYSPDAACSFE